MKIKAPRNGRHQKHHDEQGGGEAEAEESKKTVVVGVRDDGESRELLTWALVKVAAPADVVVALHVLTARNGGSGPEGTLDDVRPLADAFHAMLTVYEGFCNLKQIELKLKMCRGSSLRKVLVREAAGFAASKLILGVNKNARLIGPSPISVAKYCARKLSLDCSVLAVSNGKVVFQRKAACELGNKKLHDSEQFSSTSLSKSLFYHDGLKSLSLLKVHDGCEGNASMSSPSCSDALSKSGLSCESIDVNSISMSTDASPIKRCRICEPIFLMPCSYDQVNNVSVCSDAKDQPSRLTQHHIVEASAEPNVVPIKSEEPLIQMGLTDDTKSTSERTKISMVQWAKQLPSRYASSFFIHAERKRLKSYAHSRSKSSIDGHAEFGHFCKENVDIPKDLELLQEKYKSVCRVFTFKELSDATSNFSPDKFIAKGGNSNVLKGCLDGKELAVKILKTFEGDLKEFISEIDIITSLKHKHIISLLGFCFENHKLILVYDLLSRGSLEENIHGQNKDLLRWDERYKVALGVADALKYLHDGHCGQSVIHRDVKSSNILVSDNFEPKLADFGLAAKATSLTPQITCSDVAGTFGYLAPEYFMYGKVNEKIDVYAFGVVLLELLSGRKPIRSGCPKGQESLLLWAKPILQGGKFKELVDPNLGDEYDRDQMERMTIAASLCIRRAPRSRPSMDTVLKILQMDDDAVRWAKSQVDSLEEFEDFDGEALCVNSNIQSHLTLALLDIGDDSSATSTEHSTGFNTSNSSVEDYMQWRSCHSSCFG